VSLVHENDLSPVLTSIRELETTFNSKYKYDWVFFSTEPLGEKFRRETSNATGATCLYEVIPRNDWSVHPGFSGHFPTASDNKYLGLEDGGISSSVYHWNIGSFAQQERMRDYDWFWRIEPGVSVPWGPQSHSSNVPSLPQASPFSSSI
jgi:mannosyltransferase